MSLVFQMARGSVKQTTAPSQIFDPQSVISWPLDLSFPWSFILDVFSVPYLGLVLLGPFGPLTLWLFGLWSFGPLPFALWPFWAFGPLGLWRLGLWAFALCPFALWALVSLALLPLLALWPLPLLVFASLLFDFGSWFLLRAFWP